MEPAVGVVVGGRYHLRRPLGKGGMATVWMGYDRRRNELVAIKFMREELAKEDGARLRFEREAIAPQQIKSPHVVAIKDHGIDGDTLYIVMELLEGEDLLKRIQREGRMTLPAAGKLLAQLADGLQAAHKLGIYHRDLKPGNIVMTRAGGEEIAKIVDFGIAKAKHAGEEAEATAKGMILGSINYISPEQLKSSKDVDHRSDLWSLGVILLRLVTGKMPFPGDDYADLVLAICTGPIPVPSTLAPELRLPLELDAYFERALQRDRTLRFQTAREMAEQFSRFLIGLPGEMSSSTEPLGGSGPRAEERAQAVAAIERAAAMISGALRGAKGGEDGGEATPVELSDADIEGGATAQASAAGNAAGNGASREEEAGAVDEEESTHLRIDVDFDLAVLKANDPPDAGAAVPYRRQAGAPETRAAKRASPWLKAVVLMLAVAGVLGVWRFIAPGSESVRPLGAGAEPRH